MIFTRPITTSFPLSPLRHPLPQVPLALDCVGSHILIASQPLEIALFEVTITVRWRVVVRQVDLCSTSKTLRDIDGPHSLFLTLLFVNSLSFHPCFPPQGQLLPSASPRASLQLVREISIMDVGNPLIDMALAAPTMLAHVQQQQQQPMAAAGKQGHVASFDSLAGDGESRTEEGEPLFTCSDITFLSRVCTLTII